MRLTIDIPDDVHRSIKIKAATEGTTLRALILRDIEEYLKSEGITVPIEDRTRTGRRRK